MRSTKKKYQSMMLEIQWRRIFNFLSFFSYYQSKNTSGKQGGDQKFQLWLLVLVTYRCKFAWNSPIRMCFDAELFQTKQESDPEFSGQDLVYSDIGEEMLQHAFEGESTVQIIEQEFCYCIFRIVIWT